MRVAIIGGGAAGFFAAIQVKENFPDSEVIIFEKSKKLLAKVKVSGGGRCNVTNGCTSIKELSMAVVKAQTQVLVGYNHNLSKAIEYVSKLIGDKKIGDILSINVDFRTSTCSIPREAQRTPSRSSAFPGCTWRPG